MNRHKWIKEKQELPEIPLEPKPGEDLRYPNGQTTYFSNSQPITIFQQAQTFEIDAHSGEMIQVGDGVAINDEGRAVRAEEDQTPVGTAVRDGRNGQITVSVNGQTVGFVQNMRIGEQE